MVERAEIAEDRHLRGNVQAARRGRRGRPDPARSCDTRCARLFRTDVSARAISERAGARGVGERRSFGDPPLHGFSAPRASCPRTLGIDDMRQAIKKVLGGGVWTPPDVDLTGGADAESAALMARLSSLTPQQVRVLMMLSEGMLNKQIAYELSVSEATVKAHVSAILQKLRRRQPHASRDRGGEDRKSANGLRRRQTRIDSGLRTAASESRQTVLNCPQTRHVSLAGESGAWVQLICESLPRRPRRRGPRSPAGFRDQPAATPVFHLDRWPTQRTSR